MRNVIAILLAAILSIPVYGEGRKNEVTVSYSQATLPQTAYLLGGVLGVAFTAGHFTFDNTVFLGALGVEYGRNVNSWFTYGGLVTLDYMTSRTYNVDSEGNRTPNGRFNLGYVSLMPVAKFRWFDHPRFGMYSKVGAGAGLAFSDGTGVSFSAQLSPVCMQYGNDKLRGVLEIGYGMQGILTLGIKKLF